MVKADLIERSAAATGLRRKDCRASVEALFEQVSAALVRGERVVVRRFGILHTSPRKTGMARNPRTGEEVPIPPGRMVRFRTGRGLRDIR